MLITNTLPELLIADANILISGIFGAPTRKILQRLICKNVIICSSVEILQEAEECAPSVAVSKGINEKVWRDSLRTFKPSVKLIDIRFFDQYKELSQARLPPPNPDKAEPSKDWQLISIALLFKDNGIDHAILSKDKDLWGTGVPLWTLKRMKTYLENLEAIKGSNYKA